MDTYHPIPNSDEKENKMTLKVFKSWIEKHPFVLDSIFGQSCLKDKNLQYTRFGSESRLFVSDSSLSSVKKQTWVDSSSTAEEEEEVYKNANVSGSYAKADYLWSPVFAKMNHSKPSKRCKLAACLVYDSIYVYGGRGICTSLKDMWRYDIGENTWFPVEENGTNRPSYLQEHTMLAYKDNLVVFGGEFTSVNGTPLWLFNLHTLSWTKPSGKQKGPVNRRGHTAVISGDFMYIFGGYIDLRGASRELWKYEFSSNTWTREKSQSREWPSARYSHSAAVFDKSMVIFGGLEEMQCKNDMWLWNMASCKWTRIKGKNSPPPLFGHSALKVGDGMLVFGGESIDGTLFNSLWRFDFDSRSWNTITPKGMISPSQRSYHSLVQIPNFLFTAPRPTSSHSAPPCTPGFDRELPTLEEENENTSFDVENVAKLTSGVSLGSLDTTALLTQNEDEAVKIKLYPTGSLDSLITTKVLRETENMSMNNQNRTCLSDETLNESQEDRHKVRTKQSMLATKSTQVKAAHSTGQSLATPCLRQQFKPQSADYLSPISSVRVYHSGTYSTDDALHRSAVVNIMVLGGTSKRGIESVDRWIDMWKCQIDPNKQGKSVKRIQVQAASAIPAQYNSKTSFDSKVAYVNFNIADDAIDNDYYDDSDEDHVENTITECVLMDLSEGDTSTDMLIVDEPAGRSKSLAPISI